MVAVSEIPTNRRLEWSIRRLSDELGFARETIQKRLADAHVRPAGARSGNPTYLLKDVVAALVDHSAGVAGDEDFDPRRLKPLDRRAWYQSEAERMSVETKAGQLIPAGEVEAEMAELARGFVQFLDTLGDQLERDVGLTAEQVDAVNKSIAKQRAALYAQLQAEDMDEAANG